jgi:hypothetical protein
MNLRQMKLTGDSKNRAREENSVYFDAKAADSIIAESGKNVYCFIVTVELTPGRHVEIYWTLLARSICCCCCHLQRLQMEQTGVGIAVTCRYLIYIHACQPFGAGIIFLILAHPVYTM